MSQTDDTTDVAASEADEIIGDLRKLESYNLAKEAAAWGPTALSIASARDTDKTPDAIARMAVGMADEARRCAARVVASWPTAKDPTVPDMCREFRELRKAVDLLRAACLEADAARDETLTEKAG